MILFHYYLDEGGYAMNELNLVWNYPEEQIRLESEKIEYSSIRLSNNEIKILYCFLDGCSKCGWRDVKPTFDHVNDKYLSPATLYTTLRKLRDYHLLDAEWVRDETMQRGGKRRRMHQLNEKGKMFLAINQLTIFRLQQNELS